MVISRQLFKYNQLTNSYMVRKNDVLWNVCVFSDSEKTEIQKLMSAIHPVMMQNAHRAILKAHNLGISGIKYSADKRNIADQLGYYNSLVLGLTRVSSRTQLDCWCSTMVTELGIYYRNISEEVAHYE
ncbi:hypothetical protein NVP1253O_56 [Vibrio phage 1.253.O._10N.286.45.B12]|nr:hypothetical protein NVP1235O_56 [Vibrio phage 1.235.O._10N.261.52.B2]AUR98580.1 hypothetical protein NVP1253O_56 [Vibrio phage 1.253.O._10N.286.45.B12]